MRRFCTENVLARPRMTALASVMWHRVAPALAAHFSLIIPDLPGYGWSDAPPSDAAHAPYTKRAMAAAMIEVMEALGHVRFRLAGHDRGGRVAYRLPPHPPPPPPPLPPAPHRPTLGPLPPP